ncbi:eukaryotic translation initiation factor 3 subunit D, partial [Dimargaris cristalligena]
MSTPHFSLHDVSENDSGWGPMSTQKLDQFKDIPYTPYSKTDKLGRVADWYEAENPSAYGRDYRGRNRRHDPYQAYGSSNTNIFAQEKEDDEGSFSLVDSRTTAMKKQATRHLTGNRNQRGGAGGAAGRGGTRGFQRLGAGRGGFQSRGGHQAGGNRRRFGWRDYDRPNRIRFATVNIGDNWELKDEIEFHRMGRLSYEVDEPTDVAFCGHVNLYKKASDRINLRMEQPLRRSEYVYYDVTASDDPIMERLAQDNKAQVFATDSVVSMLMCTTRTAYPWDIIVNRVGDKLYLDKRTGGPLDFVTVNENAADPPIESSDKDAVNTPSALAMEATRINREFAMQVVDPAQKIDMAEPNPFHDDSADERPASAAYRYRLFDIST